MTQTRQGICSTDPKGSTPTPTKLLEEPLTPVASNEVHICVEHIRKLYTNNIVSFPILYQSVKRYIMMAYHCDRNTILFDPLQS